MELFRVVGDYAVLVPTVKCTICGKEVNWRKVVNHYFSHEGKGCPICGSKVKETEYKNHVRRHFVNKRKVYMCGVCGRQFAMAKSLLVHIMKNHEE